MARILGIDYGTKRIGVALSDESGKIAFPLIILDNNMMTLAALSHIVKENEVEKIVLGESQDTEGKENKIMKEAKVFSNMLQKATGAEIIFEKEYFTSFEAHRADFEAYGAGKGRMIDDKAAALILQRYLDKTNNQQPTTNN